MSESATPTSPASGAAPSFYTRQATGFVREISTGSNIALNVSFISLPLAVLIATQAPFAFPGAEPVLGDHLRRCALCLPRPALRPLHGRHAALGRRLRLRQPNIPSVGRVCRQLQHHRLVPARHRVLRIPACALRSLVCVHDIGVAAHSERFVSWGATLGTSKNWAFAIGAVALVLDRPLDESQSAPCPTDLQRLVCLLAHRDRAVDHSPSHPRA